MYLTLNEGKFVIAERFIRTLKNKIYKYMTSDSKNVYDISFKTCLYCLYELDDVVNKYNNTYHNTIKLKPTDVKSNTYIDSSKEINNKDPKFKMGNIVKISKYENIFAKCAMGNTLLVILKKNKSLECFMKKNRKKQIKNNLELKKQ